MIQVDEIERAIDQLSSSEFARIARHVRAPEQERWDAQLDNDAASGKLDFLVDEAIAERRGGKLTDWPDSE